MSDKKLKENMGEIAYDHFEHFEVTLLPIIKTTLIDNKDKIEEISAGQAHFSNWFFIIEKKTSSKATFILWEIAQDFETSFMLAIMGNYKYAIQTLRNCLETTFNFIYYFDHPIEFEWWLDGEEDSKYGHELLDRYYFKFDNFKRYDKHTNFKSEIRRLYNGLSKYIHSRPKNFQSKEKIKYNTGKFNQWMDYYKYVNETCNILMILRFPKYFKDIKDKDWILEYIPSKKLNKLKQSLQDDNIFEL